MLIFKKTTFRFYSDKDIDILIKNFKKNVAPWNDFSNMRRNRTGKLYEVVIAKNSFMFRQINSWGMYNYTIEYKGKIEKKNKGSEIIIELEIEPSLQVLFLAGIVLIGLVETGAITYSIINKRITGVSIICAVLLFLSIAAIHYFKPTISSIEQRRISRIFQ